MTTLTDRLRRACRATTAHGRPCILREHNDDIEPHRSADGLSWRDPAWLRRARANGGLPALDFTNTSPL